MQEEGGLLWFGSRGGIRIWRDEQFTSVIDEIPAERDGHLNDVFADIAGRAFCGTLPTDDHPGRLYRLELGGRLTQVLDDAGTSNGFGFTPDCSWLYDSDSIEARDFPFRLRPRCQCHHEPTALCPNTGG